jgi:hypothetical protein
MDQPPDKSGDVVETTADAVALLLRRCPEFEPEWIVLRDMMEATPPEEVGIYNVFAQVVLPALQALLTTRPSTDEFKEIIPPSETDRLDLINRLYDVLDSWAASTSEEIRGAVFLELTEGDYGGHHGDEVLTVDAMLAHAGPKLRSLIEQKRRGWWGPFEDLLRDG